jgi:hypothetical protein
MTGQEFMARLVALIPPPRSPLVRDHGVFAPHEGVTLYILSSDAWNSK